MSLPTSIPDTRSTTVPDSVTDSVSNTLDSAKQVAGQLGDHLRQQVATRADQQRETAAAGLSSLAEAVRQMGDGLKTQDQSPVTQFAAQYGDSLASQVERAANYLRERDAGRIVSDIEDLARRSPGPFLAGAFVLGVLGSRFLKSSRPAPDFLKRMPDPSRALPPATYPVTTAPSWPSSTPHSATSSGSPYSTQPSPAIELGSGSWSTRDNERGNLGGSF